MVLLCRNPSTISLCPLARRLFSKSQPEMPRNKEKCCYVRFQVLLGTPAAGTQMGGPLGVLPVTSSASDTGQGRLSTRKNESWSRKHTLCPQLFQEGSLPLIFCTVSFFIFKPTFIHSHRRKPCSVRKQGKKKERDFLGHLHPDGTTSCVQQTGRVVDL